MKALELKIPPVIVFVIAIVGIYYSPKSETLISWLNGYAEAVGSVVFLCGVGIGLLGVITFRRARTTINPVAINKASQLVTHGVFAYTRNPMYLGLAIGVVAAGLYRQVDILNILFCLFFFAAYMTRFQIVPEERMLTELFGEEFEAYQKRTRRWI